MRLVSQGDKNFIRFDGTHNSQRPPFFYDSVSIFFLNTLHPPDTPPAASALRPAAATGASADPRDAPPTFVAAEMAPPPLVPVGAAPSAELELLMQMGFPRGVAERALRRFRSVEVASSWLVDAGEEGWGELLREGALGGAPPAPVQVQSVQAVAAGSTSAAAGSDPAAAAGGAAEAAGAAAVVGGGAAAFGDADDEEGEGGTDRALAAALARSLAAAGARSKAG